MHMHIYIYICRNIESTKHRERESMHILYGNRLKYWVCGFQQFFIPRKGKKGKAPGLEKLVSPKSPSHPSGTGF